MTEEAQSTTLESEKDLAGISLWDQSEAENNRSKVQHQKRFKTTYQFLRKLELEWKRLLQQLNQSGTAIQDNIKTLKITIMILLITKKYLHS